MQVAVLDPSAPYAAAVRAVGLRAPAAGRIEISARLFRFYDRCARIDVPGITALAETIERWQPGLLVFLERAHSGALPCGGLPAVIVSSAVSPKLSQLASGASHPRGAPLAELRAVRRARSLVRRGRSLVRRGRSLPA